MLLKKNELRYKILRWLKALKNLPNITTIIPFSTVDSSTFPTSSSVKMLVNLSSNNNNSNYVNDSQLVLHKYTENISFEGLDITKENFADFVKILQEYGGQHNNTNNDDLIHNDIIKSEYCCDEIRNFLLQYKYEYHGYVSLLICVFGTIANILNIIVLTRKDMSKTPINKILKWLAVADMFVMIEYIPFTTYMYIVSPVQNGQYTWAIYLLFHMHFTQILHTISISLTVTLAIWRYVAIKHPHGNFSQYLFSHCSEVILFSFIIAPILCFPTFLVFYIKHEKSDNYLVDAQEETFLYSFNFWVHSILIKLLPCCILTVISFILVRVLCDATKRRMKLKEYSQPKNEQVNLNGNHRRPSAKHDRRPDRTTMLLVAVLFLFLITEFPQGILGLLSGILGRNFFLDCYIPFGELMDLLALFNAAVGFVLYGLMSKQFRTSFKSLFFETRLSRLEMTRITGMNNTTCV